MNFKLSLILGVSLVLAACGDDAKEDVIDIPDNNSTSSNNSTAANSSTANNSTTSDNVLATAQLTELFRPANAVITPDLDFHPTRDELWLVHRRPLADGMCVQADPGSDRCRSLAGFTTIITDPAGEATSRIAEDGNSWHFMRRPPAIAMGSDDSFATCGEFSTGNFEDSAAMFIGPTLWSADPAVYAQPSGGNGSHLDMLHATPWCVGIAHEVDNVYWTFNGHIGALDRYDFNEDHGPGNDDHSDGTIHRYIEGELSRVEDVPGHLVFDPTSETLYVADTGNGRILELDTTSGEQGSTFQPVYEQLAEWGNMLNPTFGDFVPAGLLEAPSGIALGDETLYVTDNATSTIHAFDMNGEEIGSFDTELPEGSLAGIAIGPEGKIWLVDMTNGTVYRVDLD